MGLQASSPRSKANALQDRFGRCFSWARKLFADAGLISFFPSIPCFRPRPLVRLSHLFRPCASGLVLQPTSLVTVKVKAHLHPSLKPEMLGSTGFPAHLRWNNWPRKQATPQIDAKPETCSFGFKGLLDSKPETSQA